MRYVADPDAMRKLARTLSERAATVAGVGAAASALCRIRAGGSEAGAVARTGTIVSEWASLWAASIRERAELLDIHDATALVGGAGGAGPALGMGRAWAMLDTTAAPLEAWYRAADPARRREVERGRALAAQWAGVDILYDGEELAWALGALAPHGLAAFFEELGTARVDKILRWTAPPDPMASDLGHTVGDAFAVALGRAWTAPELSMEFRTALVAATAGWEALFHAYARTGGGFPAEFAGMLTAKVVAESARTDIGRNPTNAVYTRREALEVLSEVTRSDPAAAVAFAAMPLWLARRAGDEEEEGLEEWVVPLLEATVDPTDAATMANLIRHVAAYGVEEPSLLRLLGTWTTEPAVLDLLGEANKAREVAEGIERYPGSLVDLGSLPLTSGEARDFVDVVLVDAAVAEEVHTAIWDHAYGVLETSASRPDGAGMMTDIPRIAGIVSLYAGSASRLAVASAKAALARADRIRRVNGYLSQSLNVVAGTPQGTVVRAVTSFAVWLLVHAGADDSDVEQAEVGAWQTRLDERNCLEMLLLLTIAENADANRLLPDHLFPDPTLYGSYEAWRDPVSNHEEIRWFVDEIRDNWNLGPTGGG